MKIRQLLAHIAYTDSIIDTLSPEAKAKYLAWRAAQMERLYPSPRPVPYLNSVPEAKKTLDLFPLDPDFSYFESPIKNDHVDRKPDLAPIPPNLIAPCAAESSGARNQDDADVAMDGNVPSFLKAMVKKAVDSALEDLKLKVSDKEPKN